MNKLAAIASRKGVTIYGHVGKNGRLGPFEVHSDVLGNNGNTYSLYKDAESRMAALIGVQNSQVVIPQQKGKKVA